MIRSAEVVEIVVRINTFEKESLIEYSFTITVGRYVPLMDVFDETVTELVSPLSTVWVIDDRRTSVTNF